jgi:hypothetical protein
MRTNFRRMTLLGALAGAVLLLSGCHCWNTGWGHWGHGGHHGGGHHGGGHHFAYCGR